MPRRLSSWLEGFRRYTEGSGAPAIFHKWAGIFCISAALERKVWVNVSRGTTYPNLYIFLVAPPGVGKGVALTPVSEMLSALDDHFLASSSVTRASLVDELKDAERHIIDHSQSPPTISFNSLSCVINEMGVFLPSYDADFMAFLTDLWDNKGYSERRRTKDLKIKMESVSLQLLAGGTPSYLTSLLPVGAWEQGFMSRVIPVFSAESILVDIFQERTFNETSRVKLQDDLIHIGKLYGKMKFTAEARDAISAWHMSGGTPKPDHPKLAGYLMRRTHQLIKLCMIASVSLSDDLVITLDHFAEALDWLIEVEAFIPDIFRAMSSGGDGEVMKETWHFAYSLFLKSPKPIAEARLINFIAERLPSHSVMRVLDLMVRTNLLREELLQGVGKAYTPAVPKK